MKTATAANSKVARLRARRRLAPVPETQVVAEILSDGTLRRRSDGVHWDASEGRKGWASGSVSGDGWTLWWERRSFEEI
jgi:hypothetical protein